MEGSAAPQFSRRDLVALAPAAALAACGRGHRDGRIAFWAMDTEGENAKTILPAFEAASGIGVDLQWLAWTSAHEKLLTAYAGGSLPDLFMLSNGWIAEFATIGAIAPVPPAHAALLRDQFPGVLAAASHAGRAYGVPWVVDTAVSYYRRDLLRAAGYDAPPTDRLAWREMLRAVKRRQGADRYAVLMQLNWPDHLMQMMAQQPDPLLRDRDGYGNFAAPGPKAMLAFYASLFAEGLAPPVTSLEADDPNGELARGWIALYQAGAWNRAELNRRTGELPRARWDVAAMPGPGPSVVAGSSLVVPSTARDPDRAWALVRYLTAPATQVRFQAIAGSLPSRPSAWAAPRLARDAQIATFAAQIARARPMPAIPEWSRITTEVQLCAEAVVRGRMTVDQAAADMNRRADAILAKRRWLLDRGRIV